MAAQDARESRRAEGLGWARPAQGRKAPRGERGSATIEAGIGLFTVMTIAVALFAMYAWIRTDTTVPRVALTMAEYVSREEAPEGAQLDALAEYLWKTDLHGKETEDGDASPAAAFVISAIRGEADADGAVTPTVQWAETIAFGDEAVTGPLAAKAGGHCTVTNGTLNKGETVFVVDVCASPELLPGGFSGTICHFSALPSRHPGQAPVAPDRGSASQTDSDPASSQPTCST